MSTRSAEGLVPPLPPFRTRPHLSHESGVAIWFTEPAGWVTQVVETVEGSEAMARFMTEEAWPVLRERHPPDTRFILASDFSRLSRYAAGGRASLVDWSRRIHRQIAKSIIVLSPDSPMLVRMGTTSASALLAAVGIDFSVHFGPVSEVVAQESLRAAR